MADLLDGYKSAHKQLVLSAVSSTSPTIVFARMIKVHLTLIIPPSPQDASGTHLFF
jgi:hypothetical protein